MIRQKQFITKNRGTMKKLKSFEKRLKLIHNKIRKGKPVDQKYDAELLGKKFDYFVRDKFDGVIVTPENRNSVRKVAYIEALQNLLTEEEITEEEITDMHRSRAMRTARSFVLMNQKAERAFNRGLYYFRYKGDKYAVPMVERVAEMKRTLAAFQEKYAAEQAAISEEE